MALTQTRVAVLLENPDGTTTEHQVAIRQGDKLRAELEAPSHGLVDLPHQGMHLMTLWTWAGLNRTHDIDEDFATFRDRCLELEPLDDDEVPPTRVAGTPSPSPSPSTGHPSNGGSTPTSTND